MQRQLRRTALGALLCAVGLAASAQAQEPGVEELAKELQALREGQEQMAKEIAEIKRLVQARPAPAAPAARPAAPSVAGKTFDIGDNPAKGERTAKLTLVEFADYQ